MTPLHRYTSLSASHCDTNEDRNIVYILGQLKNKDEAKKCVADGNKDGKMMQQNALNSRLLFQVVKESSIQDATSKTVVMQYSFASVLRYGLLSII